MSPRLKLGVVFFSTVLTLMLVLGAVTGQSTDNERSAYRPLGVYTDVLAKIKSDYVEEPDMAKVTQGALQGLVEYLDPLSSYLSAEQYKVVQERRKNADGGSGLSTGLVIQKRNSLTYAMSVLPGSPADEAGIRPGDYIEALDGLSTRVMPPAYLHAMLSGQPGSTVTLLVRPARNPDEPIEKEIIRAAVSLPPVQHRMLEDGIGYLDVDVLTPEQVSQTAAAIKTLQSQGAEKYILDLRETSWGDPAEGVRLANLFLGQGRIASLKGQQYPEKPFDAEKGSALTDAPVVVIADQFTAGGAEVAAAAILDNKRGQIAGQRTYGLAAVQETLPLEDGAALILSVAKFYRPSGNAVQEGIEPSAPLTPAELRRYRTAEMEEEDAPPPTEPPAEQAEDPFLRRAIELLRNGISAMPKAA